MTAPNTEQIVRSLITAAGAVVDGDSLNLVREYLFGLEAEFETPQEFVSAMGAVTALLTLLVRGLMTAPQIVIDTMLTDD